MPKQLINLIGILVSVAVLALGVFLVAMPLATQALAVNGQAQHVAQTNMLYQAQVDALTKAKANKAETDAAVVALRAQIPASPQLDQVFDLVARASESTGATITSVTAGTQAAFVATTSASTAGGSQPQPAPSPSPSATAAGIVGQAQQDRNQSNAQTAQTNAALGASTAAGAAGTGASGQSRTQIPFAIVITATNMDQATAFLDALRSGPRLLANIKSVVIQNGPSIQASISAIAFVDGAATTGGTK